MLSATILQKMAAGSAVSGKEFRAIVFNAASAGNLLRLQVFLNTSTDAKFRDDCLNVRDGQTDKIALVGAARNGHYDCVKYLVEMGADVSVCGTVTFDGEVINSAPAVWVAAAAGYLDVVKYLVEEGHADINQTTHTNSSPLRGACYDGHLHIVEYLVEKGADMELSNRHGHTPLMIASFRQKVDVVKFLLERGADPSRVSRKGNTALHDAAEANCVDVVRLLLERGVEMTEDESGTCPLMGAAMMGNKEVFEVLLQACRDGLRRKDALRILGCTLVDKKMDISGGMKRWLKALSIELTVEEMVKEEMRRAVPLHKVYGEYREVESMEEMRQMLSDPNAIRMQSLILREMILGGQHTDVHYFLRLRGAVYCDLGQVDRCFELWTYALDLQQKHQTPLHVTTLATLSAFNETFYIALSDHTLDRVAFVDDVTIKFSHINDVFERICVELEKVRDWGDRPLHEDCTESDHHHDIQEEKEEFAHIALNLLSQAERLRVVQSRRGVKVDEERVDVQRLVNVCNCIGVNILTTCVHEKEMISGPPLEELLNYTLCVEQLLQCNGMDVNGRDSDGNSALHLALQHSQIRPSLVIRLLDAGASMYMRDVDGRTPLEVMRSSDVPSVNRIVVGRYVSLCGAASLAVRRHRLPFAQIIPPDLHAWVEGH